MKRILLAVVAIMMVTMLNAKNYTVTVKNYSFTPNTLDVKVGDSVTWNFTEGSHTTTSGSSCTGDGKWDSGTKGSGSTFVFVFTSTGTYNYFCTPHCSMGMTGSITVATTSGVADAPKTVTSFSAFPNPSLGSTNVSVTLAEAANVKLAVFDLNGKMVFENNNINAGSTNVNYSLDMQTWKSGMYLTQLYVNGVASESKIIVKQ